MLIVAIGDMDLISQFPTAIKKTRTKKDLDYINNNHLSNSLFY